MKKIIAAFDGLKFSESTKSYAVHLAKQSSAHLVGVFFDDPAHTSYSIYDLVFEKGGLIGSAARKWNKKDSKTKAISVKNFELTCQKEGLAYTIHHDRSIPIRELLLESVYADLLIIDSRETFTIYPEKAPTGLIRDLLPHVQCPCWLHLMYLNLSTNWFCYMMESRLPYLPLKCLVISCRR
jgi:hypothetical protein